MQAGGQMVQLMTETFVQGIQFLIKEDVLKIPSTTPGSSSDSNEIPSWIKNSAGWWADGSQLMMIHLSEEFNT